MAYQMTSIPMNLSDPEGHFLLFETFLTTIHAA